MGGGELSGTLRFETMNGSNLTHHGLHPFPMSSAGPSSRIIRPASIYRGGEKFVEVPHSIDPHTRIAVAFEVGDVIVAYHGLREGRLTSGRVGLELCPFRLASSSWSFPYASSLGLAAGGGVARP